MAQTDGQTGPDVKTDVMAGQLRPSWAGAGVSAESFFRNQREGRRSGLGVAAESWGLVVGAGLRLLL